MFDIAYTPEASIEAATIELKKFKKTKSKSLLDYFFEEKCENCLTYWGIWYGTHGV